MGMCLSSCLSFSRSVSTCLSVCLSVSAYQPVYICLSVCILIRNEKMWCVLYAVEARMVYIDVHTSTQLVDTTLFPSWVGTGWGRVVEDYIMYHFDVSYYIL